jgi:hypothetical protein
LKSYYSKYDYNLYNKLKKIKRGDIVETKVADKYFDIPKRPDFLDGSYHLNLTEQSKALFELGKPGQGYVGLVDLETGEIHLYPSFNKHDGLLRQDKYGNHFETEQSSSTHYVESREVLGSLTGDLHINAASELLLTQKSGTRRGLMGFGIWKAGCAVKFLNATPNITGLIRRFKCEAQFMVN